MNGLSGALMLIPMEDITKTFLLFEIKEVYTVALCKDVKW